METPKTPSIFNHIENNKESASKQTSGALLTIINKDYRQLFTEKKASFIKTPRMLDVEKKLKQEHQNKCRESSSESIDTLGGGGLVTGDVESDVGAFIMGFRESVSGHGIRDLGQFGLYNGNTVISKDAYTIRGAKAAEIDHQELDFNEIKILGMEGSSIIIGLKSSQLLTIKAISLESNSIQTLKNYDLAQEKRDDEKAKLQESLKKTSNWQDNLKTANDLISNQYRGSYDVEKAILFDDFAIIPVNQYNRNYDYMITYVDFFVYGKNFSTPVKLRSHYCEYDRSRFAYSRFFSVIAKTTIEQINKKKLKLTINIRSEGSPVNTNTTEITIP